MKILVTIIVSLVLSISATQTYASVSSNQPEVSNSEVINEGTPAEIVSKPIAIDAADADAFTTDVANSDSTATEEETPAKSPWELGGWLTLNGSQASFRNWSQGGVNNITGTSTARFTAVYRRDRYVFNNSVNLKYGKSRVSGIGYRKTDDEIRIRNQIRRILDDPRFSLIAQLNFDTQFDEGFDRANTTVISKFLAPAYVIQTVGFAYNPDKWYQIDMGISMRQTIVSDTTLSTRYGLKPGETLRNEGGISIGVNMARDIATNVNYTGQLATFTNLLEPVNYTSLRFTNELIGKINSYLTANVQLAFIYDRNITRELQVKQVISVGFSYRFL
jgi:hypothetical protein